MWNPNIRPHGECFALNQAVTTTNTNANQTANNPMRLDQAQGGTAIRMVVPREAGSSLSVPTDGTVTMTVRGRTAATNPPVVIGTARYTNDTGDTVVLDPDSTVLEFVLPQNLLKYPYIDVQIQANVATVGTVDVFPHQVSHPRRY